MSSRTSLTPSGASPLPPRSLRSLVALAALGACTPVACIPHATREPVTSTAASAPTPLPAPAPKPPEWTEAAPAHTTQRVTVAPDVSVEVLDLGGSGPPLIFLAGLGNTAHVFDGFAPALTDAFHVYGVTRRGFGLSSVVPTGYDVATLARDLDEVLSALHLTRASFVAHSAAGDELTWLAAAYPARIDRVVYLDAAYDRSNPALRPDALGDCFNVTPPEASDLATAASFGAWFARTRGVELPESEVHMLFDHHGTPDVAFEQFMKSLRRPDYAHVTAPALAIYAVPATAADYYPAWPTMDEAARKRAHACFDTDGEQPASSASRADFRARMQHGRTVEMVNARHYLFLSNRDQVLSEMRAFLKAAK
jgi:pimeloyl-ACP methyl ester carboxylesterase